MTHDKLTEARVEAIASLMEEWEDEFSLDEIDAVIAADPLTAIAEKLAEALRKRITHGTNCRRIYDPDLTCDCGYEDAKKALAEYRGEAP